MKKYSVTYHETYEENYEIEGHFTGRSRRNS